jgi:hypothetical protein
LFGQRLGAGVSAEIVGGVSERFVGVAMLAPVKNDAGGTGEDQFWNSVSAAPGDDVLGAEGVDFVITSGVAPDTSEGGDVVDTIDPGTGTGDGGGIAQIGLPTLDAELAEGGVILARENADRFAASEELLDEMAAQKTATTGHQGHHVRLPLERGWRNGDGGVIARQEGNNDATTKGGRRVTGGRPVRKWSLPGLESWRKSISMGAVWRKGARGGMDEKAGRTCYSWS